MTTLSAFVSIQQLIVILVIVALLFGTKRIASIGKDLGDGIKSLRGAMKETEVDENE